MSVVSSCRTFPTTVSLWLSWAVGIAIVGWAEWLRFREAFAEPQFSFLRFLVTDWNLDSTPYLVLLLAVPVIVGSRAARRRGASKEEESRAQFDPPKPPHTAGKSPSRGPLDRRDFPAMMLVAAIAWFSSGWVASRPVGAEGSARFGDLPPAYHDEYSYLFQARTFLAGRWWFPSHPTHPELFDQMHVLNEGKFASRYFPGAGLWMAPFVALGQPYVGHRLAAAWVAVGLFLAGRELGGFRVGGWAGLLTALCPGLALFSNLLLAHHPTLVGLATFLPAMLHFQRAPGPRAACIAGAGLGFAMLCRPMTAAAFALPFGAFMIRWIFTGQAIGESPTIPFPRRLISGLLMGLPLLAGGSLLMIQNAAITGDVWRSPYQEYTEIYTPRHVYGFNNVIRGERSLGPKVRDEYDRWAQNLTPALALRNERNRWIASAQWTLGIVPLTMMGVLFFSTTLWEDRRWRGIAGSVLSLHAAHIPYWFDGILHWHYVFETAPSLLMMTAGVTGSVQRLSENRGIPALSAGWKILIGVALSTAYVALDLFLLAIALMLIAMLIGFLQWTASPRRAALTTGTLGMAAFVMSAFWAIPFWPIARLDAAASEIGFSRARYAEFQRQAREAAAGAPALILVSPDPTDRHIDYVTNDPALRSQILVGRLPPADRLATLRDDFPGRKILIFNALTKRWAEL